MKRIVYLVLFVAILNSGVFGQSGDDFGITQNSQGFITITSYEGTARQVVIPRTIEGIRVSEIGRRAFGGKQLTSVTIPNGVTTIRTGAFANNQLTSITIPNSVTIIEYEAFARNQLTSVTIPGSVAVIGGNSDNYGDGVFSGNQLTSVTISNGVRLILGGAFANNQLTEVVIPNSVTSIRTAAFTNNPLTSITIPRSVTHIEGRAFDVDQLTSVTLGANAEFDLRVLPSTLATFYTSQGRRAGTYTWNGRIWSVR